ncbi:MAG: alpha/beta hydrolase family protein [Ferruginibacter sp.]|nr:alpha/beta hydrolase family protein [Ferruginibacter sp.]
MKKFVSFLFLLCCVNFVYPQGRVVESLELNSRVLGKTVKYSIYLPANYNAAQRRFPVLYLLHGYSDDETGWTQFGEVERITNDAVSKNEATEMIIAMPDAGVSWYINDAAGKLKFEDFFVSEFIPYIDSMYKTRAKKEYRSVAGLSMGGYGTLIYAMKHPELFVACAPLSAAVWSDDHIIEIPAKDWTQYKFNELYGSNQEGKARLTKHWYSNSIIKLAETIPVEKLNQVRYYIDCGDDDFLIEGNMALHAALTRKKVKHEFRVRDGVHDWTYWRTALPEVLKFITESFHR